MSVIRALAGRLLHGALVIAAASVVVFLMGEALPGDRVEVLLGRATDAPDPEQARALAQSLGLHDPLAIRYGRFVRGVASGDLGLSWQTGDPVTALVSERAAATLTLAAAAFGVIVFTGIGTAGLAVFGRKRQLDTLCRAVAILGASIPAFWLATLLIEWFGVRTGWLPFVGCDGPAHLVLPAVSLGLGTGMMQGRLIRSALLDLASHDFYRFAMSAGLHPGRLFWRRLLPNVTPYVLTIWSMAAGQLLGGAFVIESVFAWPGIGRLAVEAVLSRDAPVFQACVLLFTCAYVVTTEAARLLQTWFDPRLAAEGFGWRGAQP